MKKLLIILLLLPSIAFGYTEHKIRKIDDHEYTSLTEQIIKSLPMLDRTHNLCYIILTKKNDVWLAPLLRGPWFLFTNDKYKTIMEYVEEEKEKAEKYDGNLFLTYWANFLEVTIYLH